tara:strand:+ start:948 stop:1244 length:297 start_codon:yes stop_codon:yes gene_type:complete
METNGYPIDFSGKTAPLTSSTIAIGMPSAPKFIMMDMTKTRMRVERGKSLEEIVLIGKMGDETEIARFIGFMVSGLYSYPVVQAMTVHSGVSASPGFS